MQRVFALCPGNEDPTDQDLLRTDFWRPHVSLVLGLDVTDFPIHGRQEDRPF